MKIKICLFFVLLFTLLITCLPFNVSAVNTDGILDENEWENIQPTVLVSGADVANCGVKNGIVYIFCDESEDRIYIGFKVKLSQNIKEDSSYGVAVSADSGGFANITPNGISSYDTDKFSVEAKVCTYSDTAFSAEVALGVKYGLETADSIRVRFIDADGIPSNVYTLKVPYDTSAKSDSFPTQKAGDGDKGTTGKSHNKVTAAKTTVPKTTKPKSSNPKAYDEFSDTASAVAGSYGDVQTSDRINSVSSEETTVLTVKQMKFNKGFTYAAVAALIILALGICVAVNLSRDKENGKK